MAKVSIGCRADTKKEEHGTFWDRRRMMRMITVSIGLYRAF